MSEERSVLDEIKTPWLELWFKVHIDNPYEILISKDELNCERYGGSIEKYVRELYEEEGVFWEGKLELVEVKELRPQVSIPGSLWHGRGTGGF